MLVPYTTMIEETAMASVAEQIPRLSAHLDDMHIGDIVGGFGTAAAPIRARGARCVSV
jgi:hypothetical protein